MNKKQQLDPKLTKIWIDLGKNDKNSPQKVKGTNLYLQKRAV